MARMEDINELTGLDDEFESRFRSAFEDLNRYSQDISRRERGRMQENHQLQMEALEEIYDGMSELFDDIGDLLSQVDRQMLNTLLRNRQRDMRRLERDYRRRNRELERDQRSFFDSMSEGFGNLMSEVTQVMTLQGALDLGGINDSLTDSAETSLEIRRDIQKYLNMSDEEYKDLSKYFSENTRALNKAYGDMFTQSDMQEVYRDIVKETGLRDKDVLEALSQSVLKTVKAADLEISNDNLEVIYRLANNSKIGPEIADEVGRAIIAPVTEFSVSSDDLISSMNMFSNEISKYSQNTEDASRRLQEIAVATTMLSDSWISPEDTMNLFKEIQNADAMKLSELQQQLAPTGMSAWDIQNRLNQGDYSGVTEDMLQSLSDAINSGNDSLAKTIANIMEISDDNYNQIAIALKDNPRYFEELRKDIVDRVNFDSDIVSDRLNKTYTTWSDRIKNALSTSKVGSALTDFVAEMDLSVTDVYLGAKLLQGGTKLFKGAAEKWGSSSLLSGLGARFSSIGSSLSAHVSTITARASSMFSSAATSASSAMSSAATSASTVISSASANASSALVRFSAQGGASALMAATPALVALPEVVSSLKRSSDLRKEWKALSDHEKERARFNGDVARYEVIEIGYTNGSGRGFDKVEYLEELKRNIAEGTTDWVDDYWKVFNGELEEASDNYYKAILDLAKIDIGQDNWDKNTSIEEIKKAFESLNQREIDAINNIEVQKGTFIGDKEYALSNSAILNDDSIRKQLEEALTNNYHAFYEGVTDFKDIDEALTSAIKDTLGNNADLGTTEKILKDILGDGYSRTKSKWYRANDQDSDLIAFNGDLLANKGTLASSVEAWLGENLSTQSLEEAINKNTEALNGNAEAYNSTEKKSSPFRMESGFFGYSDLDYSQGDLARLKATIEKDYKENGQINLSDYFGYADTYHQNQYYNAVNKLFEEMYGVDSSYKNRNGLQEFFGGQYDSVNQWNKVFKNEFESLIDGSHENGLWKVPRDGYIARLHKGETVLPFEEAERWRRANGSKFLQWLTGRTGVKGSGGFLSTLLGDYGNNIVQSMSNAISSVKGMTGVPSEVKNVTEVKKLSGSKEEFINTILPGAIESYYKYGVLPSITMAQGALESGWGKSAIGNNLFGIKAGSNWDGPTQTVSTKEDYGNGMVSVVDTFRDYGSISESVLDHGKLVGTADRYEPVRSATNYVDAANALYSAGYATDPQYASKITGVIESNGMSYYDNPQVLESLAKEYGIPMYEKGIDRVPETQMALVHKGEKIVPKFEVPAVERKIKTPSYDSKETSLIIETLRWGFQFLGKKIEENRAIVNTSETSESFKPENKSAKVFSLGGV